MKKTVTKALVVLMALSIIVGLAACGKKTSQYVGEWKATTASAQGTEVDLGTLGLAVNISVREDGTIAVTAAGQTEEGTWKEIDGGISITSGGESMDLKMADGKLQMTEPNSGLIMNFEKQQ